MKKPLVELRRKNKQLETLLKKVTDENVSLRQRIKELEGKSLYVRPRLSDKPICELLFIKALEIRNPDKVFTVPELVGFLKEMGYSGRSFNKDPNRTVYNCLLNDKKKRFHRVTGSTTITTLSRKNAERRRKGFVLDPFAVMQLLQAKLNYSRIYRKSA